MSTYKVNEIFYSVQGEGFWTGRPAVFVRFSGCNLWTGEESDRASSICTFCDTEFTDYTEYDTPALMDAIETLWPTNEHRMVIFTGGEPALQLNDILLKTLQYRGYYTAIETNGTKDIPSSYLDWVCVSPKTPKVRVKRGDELKFVYPQRGLQPYQFADLSFDHFWISPMDGPYLADNTTAAVDYVLANPRWRLSIQTHKVIGAR